MPKVEPRPIPKRTVNARLAVALAGNNRRPPLAFDPKTPGWVTNGHYLAFVGGVAQTIAGSWSGGPKPGFISETLGRLDSRTRVALTEVFEKYIPPFKVCDGCKGSGDPREGSKDEHTCGYCDGEGELLQHGQHVFVDATGREHAMNVRYRPLFGGLDIVRLGDDPHAEFGGLADGELVLVLMPLRAVATVTTEQTALAAGDRTNG